MFLHSINNLYYISEDYETVSLACKDYSLNLTRPVLVIKTNYDQTAQLVLSEHILAEFIDTSKLTNKDIFNFATTFLPEYLDDEPFELSGITIISWLKNNIKSL